MESESDGNSQDSTVVWRKYGEKVVEARKQAIRRSYYRCICYRTATPCSAKKRVDRLVSSEAGDAPLAVLYINRHNHAVGHNDSLGGQGQETSSDWSPLPPSTEEGGQQALESLSAEDIARAMYNDLMLQLSMTRRAEGLQSAAVPARAQGVDSGEDLSQDLSAEEDRRLVNEAEELLSALLEASSDVVVAPAASAEPGRIRGSRGGDSVLATSSSDVVGPDSPQVAASGGPLLLEARADPHFFPTPSTDSTLLAPTCTDPTHLMSHMAEDSSWHPLGPPLLPPPSHRLPYPCLDGGTEGSKWAESLGYSAFETGVKPTGHMAVQQLKAESPLQVPQRSLIVDWDVAQLLESVMGPPTARSGSNWSPREQRAPSAAGMGHDVL